MEWLDPWWSTADRNAHFHEAFLKQLQLEVSPHHQMFGLPVRLIARGNGDDALFELLDGSGRVAVVHLTWAKVQEDPPWPVTTIYPNIESFVEQCMRPEHEEWLSNQD